MKRQLIFAFCVILSAGVLEAAQTNAPASGAQTNSFKTDKEKLSYSIGFNIGSSLKRDAVDIDFDLLSKALKDVLTGQPTAMNEQEVRQTLMNYGTQLNARRAQERKLQGEKNKKEGEDFLAQNKNKPGVVSLPDGLQYKVLKEGTGAMPHSNDTVTVNYRGMLINGTEFDSSYKRKEPTRFAVNMVIRGWTEALQMMKEGSKWQLWIPANLAYGESGRPPNIPPASTLIFEVELISIAHPPAQPPHLPTNAPVTSDIIKVPSAEDLKKGAKIEVIKPEDLQKLQQQQQQNKPK